MPCLPKWLMSIPHRVQMCTLFATCCVSLCETVQDMHLVRHLVLPQPAVELGIRNCSRWEPCKAIASPARSIQFVYVRAVPGLQFVSQGVLPQASLRFASVISPGACPARVTSS